MECEANSFHVEFPDFSCSILQKLNQQRQIGQLCDITVVIQGHRFRAHRAVLAASSPYFCDQVLLKNSMRVVLPDVMPPSVFESLLQSCYTGTLTLPVGEIVAFLTAASFLQMWHVVDKCTELLGGAPAGLCPKPDQGGPPSSPGNGCYGSPRGVLDFEPSPPHLCAKVSACREGDLERLGEGCFSPRAPEHNASSPYEQDHAGPEGAAQDGDDRASDVTDFHYARPAYFPSSIMYHKRWVQVKAEKLERDQSDDDNGVGVDVSLAEGTGPEGRDQEDGERLEDGYETAASTSSLRAHAEEKLELEENQVRSYDEPLDFYGASMEEFSSDKLEPPPDTPREDCGSVLGEEATGLAAGIQEETSHSGFAAVVYKLYPCQCGKSFTHKSQRDRHMGMHLGLRPYGCAVCGKKFKMKHHLVGHMKIHTGVKPYECSICTKRFMWRDSFHRHVSSCTRAQQAKRAAAEQAAQTC